MLSSLLNLLANDTATSLSFSLLLQVSLLTGLVVLLALSPALKRRAALRYALLLSTLLALLPMAALSVFTHLNEQALLVLRVSEAFERQPDPIAQEHPAADPAAMVVAQQTDWPAFASDSGAAKAARTAQVSVAQVLWLTWLSGTVLASLRLLGSVLKLRRLVAESRPVPADFRQKILPLLHRQQPGGPRIRLSTAVYGPVLIGFRRQFLLLPQNCVNVLNDEEWRSVLTHELAHYQRGDTWQNLLQKSIVAVYWFHPLVHLMDRMLDRAREEICDNHVLASHSPCTYGEALLRLSLSQSSSSARPQVHPYLPESLALGILDNEWKLEHRIRELLNTKREKSMNLNRSVHNVILALVASTAVSLTLFQVMAAENTARQDNLTDTRREQLETTQQQLQDQERSLDQRAVELDRQQQAREERLAQLQERLAEREQRIQEQAQLDNGELEESLRQMGQELSMVYAEVRAELEQQDFSSEINGAMEEIRQKLQMLETEQFTDEPYVDITRQALESALQSLETINVVELRERILRSMEIHPLTPDAPELDSEFEIEAPAPVPAPADPA
ncbi:MAG: M56 family metallopeptidase [Gammaproteobacteria bacterium]|nr:M48 family metalloprotease [Pseudomonadales bacterium]MCP5348978.1 M48 family metalloprotease [Pseudomonadales bacterium]